jgi:acyl-CoA-binding protein
MTFPNVSSRQQQRVILFAGTAVAAVAVTYVLVYWKRTKKNHASRKSIRSQQHTGDKNKSSSISASFEHACTSILPEIQDSLSTGEQLLLYALYKQATIGDAPLSSAPPVWQITAHAKHSSWSHLRHMSFDEAMEKYVYAIHEIQKQVNGDGENDDDDENDYDQQEESAMGFAPVTSRPLVLEQDDNEHDLQTTKTQALFFQAAASNHASQLQQLLEEDSKLLFAKDGMEQTALHLAADKNAINSLQILLQHPNINVNAVDKDGISVLQVAAIAGNTQVCRLLLQAGADPDIVDEDGDSARSCVEEDGDDNLKALFAEFASQSR